VNKLKEIDDSLVEPSVLLHAGEPDPPTDNVNIIDVGHVVDALKGKPYPFAGPETCD